VEALARYRDANLLFLRAISDGLAYGQSWTNSRVTQALVEAREEIKYNLDAFNVLVQSGLINLFEYDKHLAASMAGGDNPLATNFAMNVCKIYLIDDRSNAHIFESDLFGTIEVLQKIATQSQRPPEGITNLMEMIKVS
jgi:CCR4-NOT transcription complex subunit 1